MSGFKIDRNLAQSSALEPVTGNSSEKLVQQNVSSVPARPDTFDPRTSGATKEAAAAKLAEQKLVGQAQEARLRALIEKRLPNLPTVGGNPAGNFGTASTENMPMGNNSDLTKVRTFKEHLYSMSIRELNDLKNKLSDEILAAKATILQLTNQQAQMNTIFILDDGVLSNEEKAALDSISSQIEEVRKSKHVAEAQYEAVLTEIDRRNDGGLRGVEWRS